MRKPKSHTGQIPYLKSLITIRKDTEWQSALCTYALIYCVSWPQTILSLQVTSIFALVNVQDMDLDMSQEHFFWTSEDKSSSDPSLHLREHKRRSNERKCSADTGTGEQWTWTVRRYNAAISIRFVATRRWRLLMERVIGIINVSLASRNIEHGHGPSDVGQMR